MKHLVNIVLLVFITFLSTPTIVSVINHDDTDISVFYSFAEEEIQKELQEVKAHTQVEFQLTVFSIAKKSSIIRSENLQRHDNVFEEIFCPPPELV
jgi:hypothetical protein